MDIAEFVKLSLGRWRSQRSAHHLAFGHFEQVTSIIDIVPLDKDDLEVIKLCKSHEIDPQTVNHPFRMSWEGESDWDEEESFKGTTILVPIPDLDNSQTGRLLRDQGYAETIPSIGNYHITEDGTFVLLTQYERATAEEKIWFVNPNFRLRVSMIKTSEGTGVVTASFSSEIRSLSNNSEN
ncbi:phycobiliprotein lyase [Aetokthonos hydrillicola Thurmond2011]|jgi:phycoerythrin-associated linker protein|uniref:Chromophore lyase CpcS/CpeS n=1 Tax=Aetokthonos hydrillicola Thurmond2011 TaxID=2712845 RepID=A0AAP5IFS1_9CYAN|nr:phycobiliprotein lyase [Aetokthonos hydrillicola]MBO3458034.1 phycobiliprotein lyase [Aetokthonos hydrillicola CCALA 1050]MBW4587131.1 phycobiliprotein lyase [Aetokthonos hydrillicola CCALA 1050]MDR9899619.1 phycobiliprotein lyase [Aetokthonos hydrillicola Thurmond2011]